MNNTGKIPALAVRLIAALITLYLYFNPTALAHAEYSLGIDGIVVAQTFCLLFALWQIVHLAEDIFSRKTRIDEEEATASSSSIQNVSEFAPRTARKKFRSVFGGVYVVKNTLRGAGVSPARLRRVKAQSGAKPPRQKGCAFLTTYLHSATAALAAAAASSV